MDFLGRKLRKKIQETTFFLCLSNEYHRGWNDGYRLGVQYGETMAKAFSILERDDDGND